MVSDNDDNSSQLSVSSEPYDQSKKAEELAKTLLSEFRIPDNDDRRRIDRAEYTAPTALTNVLSTIGDKGSCEENALSLGLKLYLVQEMTHILNSRKNSFDKMKDKQVIFDEMDENTKGRLLKVVELNLMMSNDGARQFEADVVQAELLKKIGDTTSFVGWKVKVSKLKNRVAAENASAEDSASLGDDTESPKQGTVESAETSSDASEDDTYGSDYAKFQKNQAGEVEGGGIANQNGIQPFARELSERLDVATAASKDRANDEETPEASAEEEAQFAMKSVDSEENTVEVSDDDTLEYNMQNKIRTTPNDAENALGYIKLVADYDTLLEYISEYNIAKDVAVREKIKTLLDDSLISNTELSNNLEESATIESNVIQDIKEEMDSAKNNSLDDSIEWFKTTEEFNDYLERVNARIAEIGQSRPKENKLLLVAKKEIEGRLKELQGLTTNDSPFEALSDGENEQAQSEGAEPSADDEPSASFSAPVAELASGESSGIDAELSSETANSNLIEEIDDVSASVSILSNVADLSSGEESAPLLTTSSLSDLIDSVSDETPESVRAIDLSLGRQDFLGEDSSSDLTSPSQLFQGGSDDPAAEQTDPEETLENLRMRLEERPFDLQSRDEGSTAFDKSSRDVEPTALPFLSSLAGIAANTPAKSTTLDATATIAIGAGSSNKEAGVSGNNTSKPFHEQMKDTAYLKSNLDDDQNDSEQYYAKLKTALEVTKSSLENKVNVVDNFVLTLEKRFEKTNSMPEVLANIEKLQSILHLLKAYKNANICDPNIDINKFMYEQYGDPPAANQAELSELYSLVKDTAEKQLQNGLKTILGKGSKDQPLEINGVRPGIITGTPKKCFTLEKTDDKTDLHIHFDRERFLNNSQGYYFKRNPRDELNDGIRRALDVYIQGPLGTESKPIQMKNLGDPKTYEVTLAALLDIKRRAIEDGKSYYVQYEGGKLVEVTSNEKIQPFDQSGHPSKDHAFMEVVNTLANQKPEIRNGKPGAHSAGFLMLGSKPRGQESTRSDWTLPLNNYLEKEVKARLKSEERRISGAERFFDNKKSFSQENKGGKLGL